MIKTNLIKNGRALFSVQFHDLIKAYHKTGLFYYVVEAFLYCRNQGAELPEELTAILEDHFRRFSNAKNKEEGLAAFSFDSNPKGGAWQGKIAAAKWQQEEILELLANLEVFGSKNKTKNFEAVAHICNTTSNRVKTLYYQSKKK